MKAHSILYKTGIISIQFEEIIGRKCRALEAALEKKVPNGKKLLTKNEIVVDGKNEKSEIVTNQLYQKPNTNILGFHLRLNLYNIANTKHDSIYKAKFTNHPEKYKRKSKWLSAKQVNRLGESFWYAGIHDFLEKSGEPPSIIDKKSPDKIVRSK